MINLTVCGPPYAARRMPGLVAGCNNNDNTHNNTTTNNNTNNNDNNNNDNNDNNDKVWFTT